MMSRKKGGREGGREEEWVEVRKMKKEREVSKNVSGEDCEGRLRVIC